MTDTYSADRLAADYRAQDVLAHSTSWPRLWWTADEDARLRERARSTPGFAERLRAEAERIIDDPHVFANEPAWHHNQQAPIQRLATAAWFFGEERIVSFATRLLDRAASAETWVAPVHHPMKADHCAANTGATFALAFDLLAGRLTNEQQTRYRNAVREKCFEPFLTACHERSEFWAQRDCVSNWRIMTCGEAGLATLGLAGESDDVAELLAYATEGVADILYTIPPDGDFVEGPHYFIATLGFGLRYLAALVRRYPEAEGLLRHPKLTPVPDYLLHITEPDGGVFDYFDNTVAWSATERATMLLLARELERGDLAELARSGDVETVQQLGWDADSIPGAIEPESTAAHFRTSGLVTVRSGWTPDATYTGVRSGPVTVGHSHLDSGSFVLTSREVRLITDEGVWPYAHFLGFFETGDRRWDFDGNATIGHSTLLIDGQGQVYDSKRHGTIGFYAHDEAGTLVCCDLTGAYEGLESDIQRWIAFLPPDCVVIYDRVRSVTARRVEALFHHRGEITGTDAEWNIQRDGVTLHVRRLPAEPGTDPWRASDVVRTTRYEDSNTGIVREMPVVYRSVGPMSASERHDFVHVLSVGDAPDDAHAAFSDEEVTVHAYGQTVAIRPADMTGEISGSHGHE